MAKRIDLSGKKFGKLLVIEIGKSIKTKKKNRVYTTWICECDCGEKITVRTAKLNSGLVESCGCDYTGNAIAVGDRFNRLVAEKYLGGEWLLLCDCGNRVIARTGNIINSHTRSCGCLRVEARK